MALSWGCESGFSKPRTVFRCAVRVDERDEPEGGFRQIRQTTVLTDAVSAAACTRVNETLVPPDPRLPASLRDSPKYCLRVQGNGVPRRSAGHLSSPVATKWV